MGIKLIATDLDRTLLNAERTISPRSAQALAACIARGIKVVFATARPLRTAVGFLTQVPAHALAIHNGAVIYQGGERLVHWGISPQVTQSLMAKLLVSLPGATLSVEIEDVMYANFDVSSQWTQAQTVQTTDFANLPDKPADKVIVGVSSREGFEGVQDLLPQGLIADFNDGKLALILREEATKARAIAALAHHWGIPLCQAVSFGDDYNDLAMLQACGTGVAMANALPQVKAAADTVCGHHDEDGVAAWLEAHVLTQAP